MRKKAKLDRSVIPFVAPTAVVSESAFLGVGTRVWDHALVGERASLGDDCIVGRGAFIDHDVRIGSRCKIQNNALLYYPAIIGSGVFIGPAATLTNDLHPRAINPDGTLQDSSDWEPRGVTIAYGATIGAQAVVLGGVRVGEWAVAAAGAVVTISINPHALVAGVPARQIGWVGKSGRRLEKRLDGLLIDPVTMEAFRDLGDRIEVRS